jgi:hypothetical protein
MGLDTNDPKPTGIALRDAYDKIRSWYQSNAHTKDSPHAQPANQFIQALPPANQLSDLEIRTVLSEVILGQLEWGYHESDGQYKMAAYAHAALDAAGLHFVLSDNEKKAIKSSNSTLLPHFSEHILRE